MLHRFLPGVKRMGQLRRGYRAIGDKNSCPVLLESVNFQCTLLMAIAPLRLFGVHRWRREKSSHFVMNICLDCAILGGSLVFDNAEPVAVLPQFGCQED